MYMYNNFMMATEDNYIYTIAFSMYYGWAMIIIFYQVISGLENEIRNLNNNFQEMKIKHRADLKELKQTSEYDKDAREKLHKTAVR